MTKIRIFMSLFSPINEHILYYDYATLQQPYPNEKLKNTGFHCADMVHEYVQPSPRFACLFLPPK